MSKLMSLAAAASVFAAQSLPAAAQSLPAAPWTPDKPIEIVVAAGPGGGTDIFARSVQAIVQKHQLLSVPIIVTNKGGGAGTEAFVYGKAVGNDPHKLVFGTNNQWLMPLVNKTGYKSDDLTPVAAMAVDEFLLWTHKDAPYKSPTDLIEAAKKGDGLKMAGSQSKDTDHILTKQIEHATGAKFTYIPFKSGGEAAVQLAGGHVDSNTNNPQENVGQWKGGTVRPLCVFSPQRLVSKEKVGGDMAWADIPTCKEAGVPIESFQMPRTVWLSGKAKPEHVTFYVELMKKVRATPEWKDWLEKGSQSDFFTAGEDFAKFVKADETKFREQFQRDGWLVN